MTSGAEPLRRRGKALREAVLAAALQELETHGDKVSVAGVARRAGVHETSVYRQFGTREDLLLAALMSASEQRVPVPDTGSLRADLIATLQMVIAGADEPLGLALLRTGVLAPGAYTEQRRAFWQDRLSAFTPIFERGIARGEAPADMDIELALEMLVAPLHSRLLVTGFPIEVDLAERITDRVLAGLASA